MISPFAGPDANAVIAIVVANVSIMAGFIAYQIAKARRHNRIAA
jgi:hypothetical protein